MKHPFPSPAPERLNVIDYLLGEVPKSSPEVPLHELARTAFDDGFKMAREMCADYLTICGGELLDQDIADTPHPYDVFKDKL